MKPASPLFERQESSEVVVGVDVGGPAKGFHGVALNGGRLIAKTKSRDANTIAQWSKDQGAVVVAVDAPCRWRAEGLARAAERQMAAQGISCYYAPTEEKARAHAFYAWMLPGKLLYDALAPVFPLYLGDPRSGPMCIETFPHAVACALAGGLVSAKQKRVLRGELIERAGLSRSGFSNIDEIDAALCAIAADRFARGKFKPFGDVGGGFIIVPATPLARTVPASGEPINQRATVHPERL